MTCAEFQEQVEAWVLGILDREEAEACAEHVSSSHLHQGCNEALAQARETAAALALALPADRPPERVWHSIEQRLDRIEGRPAVRAWRGRLVSVLAAAAVVAIVALGWALADARRTAHELVAESDATRAAAQRDVKAAQGVARRADTDRQACLQEVARMRSNEQLQRDAMAMLEDPSTRVVALAQAGAGAYRASAIFNAASGRAIVVSSALSAKPGSDFELWVIRGKAAPAPAGFLKPGPDGVAAGEIDRALLAQGAPDAFAVSLEPAGGRPTPTQVILVGSVKT